MAAKIIPPELGENSFSCPHCGAIAHQTWFTLHPKGYEKDSRPRMPVSDVIERIEIDRDIQDKTSLIEFFTRTLAKEIFAEVHEQSSYIQTELINLYISHCYSCGAYAVWVADNLIYPSQPFSVVPNEDAARYPNRFY